MILFDTGLIMCSVHRLFWNLPSFGCSCSWEWWWHQSWGGRVFMESWTIVINQCICAWVTDGMRQHQHPQQQTVASQANFRVQTRSFHPFSTAFWREQTLIFTVDAVRAWSLSDGARDCIAPILCSQIPFFKEDGAECQRECTSREAEYREQKHS